EVGVENIGDPCDARCQFLEKTDPLLSEREHEPREARDIAARPGQTCNKALADWIADGHKYDRYGVGRLPQCRDSRRSNGKCHVRRFADQLGCVGLDARGVGATPAIVDLQVAALAPAMLLHRLPEHRKTSYHFRIVCSKAAEHADPPHTLRLLLRAGRLRPGKRHATAQRYELASPHRALKRG